MKQKETETTKMSSKRMLKELFDYVKKYKKEYTIIAVSLMLSYALALVPTRVTQHIINQISDQTLTVQGLIMLLGLLVISTLIAYVNNYIWMKVLFGRATKYRFDMRKEMFQKLLRMRTPFYNKFRSGDMLTRFTSDTTDFSELLGYGVMCIFSGLGTIAFVLPAMMLISWQITLLAAIPIVCLGVCIYFLGKKQDEASEQSREAVASLSSEVLEVIEGIRVTRAYGKKVNGQRRFRERTADLVRKSSKVMSYTASYGRLAYFFVSLSTAIIIGGGGLYIQQQTLELGDVIALQLYSLMLMEPMWLISDVILVYHIGKIAFGKIHELLTTSDDMEEDGTLTLDQLETIQMRDYSFQYDNSDKLALDRVTVSIERGKTLGIVGKTGSGKTTFIRQLLRQYPVGRGVYTVNGEPIEQYYRREIENKIGYVPQEHVLFSKSVLENIRFAAPNSDRKQVDATVHAASFSEDVNRMSDGYDTLVGEKGVSISGGQKQRISIARAFIKDPELLILDDSLSAVDARTERIIIENIQALREGKTNVIVTHRLSAVNHADWVIVLDEGKIVEEGTPENLLAQKGWYFEQYERQQMEERE